MVKVVCWPRQLMVIVAERSSPVVFVCRVIVSVLGPEPPLLGLMSTHVSSEALLVVDTLAVQLPSAVKLMLLLVTSA